MSTWVMHINPYIHQPYSMETEKNLSIVSLSWKPLQLCLGLFLFFVFAAAAKRRRLTILFSYVGVS